MLSYLPEKKKRRSSSLVFRFGQKDSKSDNRPYETDVKQQTLRFFQRLAARAKPDSIRFSYGVKGRTCNFLNAVFTRFVN